MQRGFYNPLGLVALRNALAKGMYATIDDFLYTYDILNEYDLLDVELPEEPFRPDWTEKDWCKAAVINTDVGSEPAADAFETSASRYYAYLHSRRFLDFSSSQTELLRLLRRRPEPLEALHAKVSHVVVDEVQDINPVQEHLVRALMGDGGSLFAVGDHRQAIFGWRGGCVDIMARFYEEFDAAEDGEVIDLPHNFRSTPRILWVANRWARTIGPVRTMSSPDMEAGTTERDDLDSSHVASLRFSSRTEEAAWIASTIRRMVDPEAKGGCLGVPKDWDDEFCGLGYPDIGILVRTSTDARTYMEALRRAGIPAVFRAGPDLFSQPEVLLFLAAMARSAGMDQFFGASFGRSLPERIRETLDCGPDTEEVILAACSVLEEQGLPLQPGTGEHLVPVTGLMAHRIGAGADYVPPDSAAMKEIRTRELREWLRRRASRCGASFPRRCTTGCWAKPGCRPGTGTAAGAARPCFILVSSARW